MSVPNNNNNTCEIIENRIDDGALRLLSREDLKSIIPGIGDQLRLWEIIQKLKTGSVYICFICNCNFYTLKDLSEHLKSFHLLSGNSEYKCVHCDRYFLRKPFLKHLRNVFTLHKTLCKENTNNHKSLSEFFEENVESEEFGEEVDQDSQLSNLQTF